MKHILLLVVYLCLSYGNWIKVLDSNDTGFLFATKSVPMNWEDAKAYCENRSSFLAEPLDVEEINFLRNQSFKYFNTNWWIGLRFINSSWGWDSSASPTTNSDWDSTMNHSNSTVTKCAALTITSKFHWNEWNCDTTHELGTNWGFKPICQTENVSLNINLLRDEENKNIYDDYDVPLFEVDYEDWYNDKGNDKSAHGNSSKRVNIRGSNTNDDHGHEVVNDKKELPVVYDEYEEYEQSNAYDDTHYHDGNGHDSSKGKHHLYDDYDMHHRRKISNYDPDFY